MSVQRHAAHSQPIPAPIRCYSRSASDAHPARLTPNPLASAMSRAGVQNSKSLSAGCQQALLGL